MRGSTFLLGPSSFDRQKAGKIPLFFLYLSSSLSLYSFFLSLLLCLFVCFFCFPLFPPLSHRIPTCLLLSISFPYLFFFSIFSFLIFSLISLIYFIFSFLFHSYPFLFPTQRILLVCFLSPFLFSFHRILFWITIDRIGQVRKLPPPSSMPHVFSTFFLDFLSFSFSLLLHHALHG